MPVHGLQANDKVLWWGQTIVLQDFVTHVAGRDYWYATLNGERLMFALKGRYVLIHDGCDGVYQAV